VTGTRLVVRQLANGPIRVTVHSDRGTSARREHPELVETLELGRDAMVRHAWGEAMEVFTTADGAGALGPDDLERLGAAAWWSGQPDESTEALERAFSGYEAAGQSADAARVAMTLAYQAFRRRFGSIGGGWQARAERLLQSLPESSLHARKAVFDSLGALMMGRITDAIAIADRAMQLAQKHGDADINFSAMSFKGMGMVFAGDWQAGIALIDESAAAASSGRLDLRIASDIFCNTMAACRNVGDLQRAAQWSEESERWMRRQSVGGYPGVCRVHRAELKRMRGLWSEAEQEARQACVELERFGLLDVVGYAHNEIGEVRLRMGDLDSAAEAFDRAYEYGYDAQPGMSLLHLARGEIDEATRSIGRALAAAAGAGGPPDRATRARLLPAQIDIALAAGDLVTAGIAVDELESIAADFRRPVFEAGALTGRGELLLGEARPSEASPLLGRSWRLWQETDLPYEAARARLQYAQALAAEGEHETARRDLRAARAAFERLGARLDIAQVDALLGEAGTSPSQGSHRLVKTFMFTDIVTSTDLVGLIGDDAWGELLSWHDRELRSAFATHLGEEVKHTGDGFFVAFERPIDAIECAVDIQRRLARHRREHGFAPRVRIGLHTTEAARQGRDYHGRGVHVAARVGGAAGNEEILVSSAVLDAVPAGRFELDEPREVMLKGVDKPVEVRSVSWR
jgi:class 3 adenylate cyclase